MISRYSVYLRYCYKSTNTDAASCWMISRARRRCSVYLRYWYKSTNTDAASYWMISSARRRCSVYLRYWYKSTNTDAASCWMISRARRRCSVYLRNWYKSTNTDAASCWMISRARRRCWKARSSSTSSQDLAGVALSGRAAFAFSANARSLFTSPSSLRVPGCSRRPACGCALSARAGIR
jgi:hypothetical protein